MNKLGDSRPAPAHFDEELLDKHFEYTYDNGWKYEFHVPNHLRINYAIHGGPMNGRNNFQTAYYQRIRPNLWQISWVEETGTTVTMALDMEQRRITTFMSFSKGHWEHAEEAHGDKRDPEALARWRGLSKIGNQTTDKHILPEQATIDKIYNGPGNLKPVDLAWPTL